MNWQEINSGTVKRVLVVSKAIKSIKSYSRRKAYAVGVISKLDPQAKFLFEVCLYHSLFNSRWNPVDITNYFTIDLDATTNRATFEDFIELLRYYEKKKVRLTKDSMLFKLLKRCNKRHFKFFAELLEKKFHENLPMDVMQEHLNLDGINLAMLYEPDERVYEQMEDLVYPVAVTLLKNINAVPKVYSKDLGRVIEYKIKGNTVKIGTQTKSSIVSGSIMSDYPKFVLAGVRLEIEDERNKRKPVNTRRKNPGTSPTRIRGEKEKYEFQPFDCFESVADFKDYVKGDNESFPFNQRITKLQEILRDGYVFGVEDAYVGFANNECELRDELSKLLFKRQDGYLLFVDENSARTLQVHAKECVKINTAIEEAWVEEGVVKGFTIWHNGITHNVSLNVGAKYPALLKNLEFLKGKVLQCVYFRINDKPYYFPVGIDWNKQPWTPRGVKGGIVLNGCVLCGGDEYANDVGGICRACMMNIYAAEKKHPESEWIAQTPQQATKRKSTGWHYSVMNIVKPRFKSYILESKEDGAWRFVFNEKAKEEYEMHLANQRWNPNRKKLGIKPEPKKGKK